MRIIVQRLSIYLFKESNANLGHAWDEFVVSELRHDKIYMLCFFLKKIGSFKIILELLINKLL
jgi:hypothetical protein